MIALVTGGASCGKSAFAEQLCTQLGGELVYLAAMRPYGEEGRLRVQRHRAQRAGKGFRTVECYEGLDVALSGGHIDGATVLLECLGNVVANELYTMQGDPIAPSVARGVIAMGMAELAKRCRHLVVVGNEVGSDGITYDAQTRAYQELVGTVACELAARADLVAEVVAGVPHVIQGTAL